MRSDVRKLCLVVVPEHYQFSLLSKPEVVNLVRRLQDKHLYKYDAPFVVSTVSSAVPLTIANPSAS